VLHPLIESCGESRIDLGALIAQQQRQLSHIVLAGIDRAATQHSVDGIEGRHDLGVEWAFLTWSHRRPF
jgi:hypothetical protein